MNDEFGAAKTPALQDDKLNDAALPPRLHLGRKKPRVLFYVNAERALRFLHAELIKYLHQYDILADIWDWRKAPAVADMRLISDNYDYIISLPGATWPLTDDFGIKHERIAVVAHGEWDMQLALRTRPPEEIDRFAGYGVVSEFLRQRSAALGIRRVPSVVRPGVNCARFSSIPPRQLSVVGYGGVFRREDDPGIDIKRGALAQKATEKAGLEFRPVGRVHFLAMPGYYRQVDAVLVASLTEGFGLPALEAAAAGRLVISTAVGSFPLHASCGTGIVAPMDESEYCEFVADTLGYYREHPAEFHQMCLNAQRAAPQFDWRHVVDDWVNFIHRLA